MTAAISGFARAFTRADHNALHASVHLLQATDPKKQAVEAHLNWKLEEAPIRFTAGKTTHEYKNRKVFYRSDTKEPLAVVSQRFKAVQPAQMLDFFREVADEYKFKLEMAGQAAGGKRIWGLAKTPFEIEITKGDKIGGYLLFVTACDGGLATRAMFVANRMWCINQLPVFMRNAKNAKGPGVVRITHSAQFKTVDIKKGLSLLQAGWEEFGTNVKALSKKKVTHEQAAKYFTSLLFPHGDVDKKEIDNKRSNLHRLIETYDTGHGQSDIKGTAWGLVNAVSRFVDHEGKTRDSDRRIYTAWLAGGSRLKGRAYTQALELK